MFQCARNPDLMKANESQSVNKRFQQQFKWRKAVRVSYHGIFKK